jgi:iron complex outermembrane receptor protein
VIVDNRISKTALSNTRGLDANLRYRRSFREGELHLDANVNLVFSFKNRLRTDSPVIDALDTPYQAPNLRMRAHAGWQGGGWSVNGYLNHVGAYRDRRGTRDLPIRAYTTFDAGIAYETGAGDPSWLRGIRVAIQVDNLFDQDPPRLLPDPGSTTGLGYDPVNASARGRFISLQLRKSW